MACEQNTPYSDWNLFYQTFQTYFMPGPYKLSFVVNGNPKEVDVSMAGDFRGDEGPGKNVNFVIYGLAPNNAQLLNASPFMTESNGTCKINQVDLMVKPSLLDPSFAPFDFEGMEQGCSLGWGGDTPQKMMMNCGYPLSSLTWNRDAAKSFALTFVNVDQGTLVLTMTQDFDRWDKD